MNFKTLLISFLVFVSGTSSFAQISIGAGYVNQSLNENNPWLLNGFYIGGGFSFCLTKSLSITPGIFYSNVRGKLDNNEDELWLLLLMSTAGRIMDQEEQYISQYLSVPVSVSFSFINAPLCKLYVFGGPILSYELRTSYHFYSPGYSVSENDLHSWSSMNIHYNRWSFGIGGGVGLDLYKHYRFTAGYEYGLNNRFNGYDYKTLQNDKSMHTQRIYVGLAYVF